jgi:5'(3')-deoxyribonucleotidase
VRPLAIITDVDGVLADFNGALSKALALEGCHLLTDEDYHTWELTKCVPKEYHKALERIAHRPGFCASIPRYDGSQEFYRRLRSQGRVMAVTTAWKGSSRWEQERFEWLLSFGFADPEIHIVFKHEEKYAVPCDVVIEDRVETLRAWPGTALRILVHRPWNKQTPQRDRTDKVFRAYSYDHILERLDMRTAHGL